MKVTVNVKAFANALKELKEIAGGADIDRRNCPV